MTCMCGTGGSTPLGGGKGRGYPSPMLLASTLIRKLQSTGAFQTLGIVEFNLLEKSTVHIHPVYQGSLSGSAVSAIRLPYRPSALVTRSRSASIFIKFISFPLT
jgi:hypothetical protein